jgi:hypothetical protein
MRKVLVCTLGLALACLATFAQDKSERTHQTARRGDTGSITIDTTGVPKEDAKIARAELLRIQTSFLGGKLLVSVAPNGRTTLDDSLRGKCSPDALYEALSQSAEFLPFSGTIWFSSGGGGGWSTLVQGGSITTRDEDPEDLERRAKEIRKQRVIEQAENARKAAIAAKIKDLIKDCAPSH